MKAEELAVRLNEYFVSVGDDPIQTHDRRVKRELEIDLVSEGIVKKCLKNNGYIQECQFRRLPGLGQQAIFR